MVSSAKKKRKRKIIVLPESCVRITQKKAFRIASYSDQNQEARPFRFNALLLLFFLLRELEGLPLVNHRRVPGPLCWRSPGGGAGGRRGGAVT